MEITCTKLYLGLFFQKMYMNWKILQTIAVVIICVFVDRRNVLPIKFNKLAFLLLKFLIKKIFCMVLFV